MWVWKRGFGIKSYAGVKLFCVTRLGLKIEEFWSDNFNLLSGQITRRFKKFDWYIGIENALNYMQPKPIRGVENPFSENFDAGMIWGLTMGRVFFSGIRLNIND